MHYLAMLNNQVYYFISLQSISDEDTTELVSTLSLSHNHTENSRNEALQLLVEAEGYQQNHHYVQDNIGRAEELLQNGSLLVDESEGLLRQANGTVHAVEVAISNLDAVESNKLREALSDIAGLLSSLQSDVSSADIELLYLSLHQTLSEQTALRQELENSLNEMQQEVEQLKYLESMLPQACNRNL